jgi:hypothetical protein
MSNYRSLSQTNQELTLARIVRQNPDLSTTLAHEILLADSEESTEEFTFG